MHEFVLYYTCGTCWVKRGGGLGTEGKQGARYIPRG